MGWTGNLVPDALTGTGEIDGGQKGLSRKETIGPGKMVVWEMGNGAQYLGECRWGQRRANLQENKTAPGVPGHCAATVRLGSESWFISCVILVKLYDL